MINKITHSHTHTFMSSSWQRRYVAQKSAAPASSVCSSPSRRRSLTDRKEEKYMNTLLRTHQSKTTSSTSEVSQNIRTPTRRPQSICLITVWWSPAGLGLREPPGSGWYWLWSDSVGGTAELILQNQNRNASPPHPDRCQATKRQENR